jgi:uncharacterized protein YdhG (YjbR/CyaY superfamily)
VRAPAKCLPWVTGVEGSNPSPSAENIKKVRNLDKKQFGTIDEYINTFPKGVQSILEKIRQTIRKVAPEAIEAISYQMPTFKLNGKYLVYFAAYKNHIGFYPTPSGTEAFKKELSPYKAGKGSARFPLGEPIPYDLVKKIVMFRIKERQAEKAIKKSAAE